MTPKVTLREALSDPALLGNTLPGDSWAPWRTLLISAMGEPLITEDERTCFQGLTHRQEPPSQRVEEMVVIAGRRGGKTRAASVLCVFIAALCDHSDKLAPGERGLALLIAQDQRNARGALRYADGAISDSTLLSKMVTGRTANSISLSNGIDLEVRAASFRRLRGFTAICCIADESCFWATDDGSANPDSEILASVRPSLATTGPGPLIICSTPHAKRGETYELFRDHFGPEGDPRILVAKGTTRDFNASLPQSVVDRALARDPELNRAEYLAEWRTDIAAFVDRSVVEAAVEPGMIERPPERGKKYHGFCDPSGGSNDSMTVAVAHKEGERIVVDLIRERVPPFSPQECVAEFARAVEPYSLKRLFGDRYAGEWPVEAFRKRGVVYEHSPLPKSELYQNLLPLLNTGNIVLPDHKRLVAQLSGLERRVSRAGKDSIDHGSTAHDDLANSVAGAAWVAQGAGRKGAVGTGYVVGLY